MAHKPVYEPLTREALEAHWMPYTGNRQFKEDPRIIVGAEGAYFLDNRGRKIFDGLSGLWCSGAGHNRPEIAEALLARPIVFGVAEVVRLAPGILDAWLGTVHGAVARARSKRVARPAKASRWGDVGRP